MTDPTRCAGFVAEAHHTLCERRFDCARFLDNTQARPRSRCRSSRSGRPQGVPRDSRFMSLGHRHQVPRDRRRMSPGKQHPRDRDRERERDRDRDRDRETLKKEYRELTLPRRLPPTPTARP